jgi:hypothetical protein
MVAASDEKHSRSALGLNMHGVEAGSTPGLCLGPSAATGAAGASAASADAATVAARGTGGGRA